MPDVGRGGLGARAHIRAAHLPFAAAGLKHSNEGQSGIPNP
jgi:hypothetical protein